MIGEAIRESPYTIPRNGDEYSPVYFLSIPDSGLEMGVTVYYEPSSPTEVVKDDVNSRVKLALEKAGIEIPFNYVNVVMNPGDDQAAT